MFTRSFSLKAIAVFLGMFAGMFFIINTVFAGTLTAVSFESSNNLVGEVTTLTFSFTNELEVQSTSSEMIFRSDFQLDEGGPLFDFGNVGTEDITVTIDAVPATVTYVYENNDGSIEMRTTEDAAAGSTIVVTIADVMNPVQAGTYTMESFGTADAGGNLKDVPLVGVGYEVIDTDLYTAEFWNFADGESPEFDFDTAPAPDYTENDFDISNVNWGESSPDGLINSDGFVARFTKTDTFIGGPVQFTIQDADDGFRVLIDDELVMERWNNSFGSSMSETILVEPGEHTIVVEYYEDTGFAYLLFSYEDFGLAGSGTLEDPWEITECYTVVYPGFYELQNDITDVQGDCIIIEADDVSIFGDEYTITSDGLQENQAIFSEGYDRIDVSLVAIEGFYDGIMLSDSEGPSSITYVRIEGAGDDGIDLHGVTDMTISDSTIIDTEDDGIEFTVYQGDIEIYNSDVVITGMSISNTSDSGMELEYITGLTITENEISNTGGAGIDGNILENADIVGNLIYDISEDGLYFSSVTNVAIEENTIDGASDDGIDIDIDGEDNYDVTVIDNILTGIGDNGIAFDEVVGAVITGNELEIADDGIEIDDGEDIEATGNIITPADLEYLEIPQIETDALVLDIEGAEISISDEDDDSFTYTLPFTFNFMGRDIINIEVNTNGAIELLEDGEGCSICDEYGSHTDPDNTSNDVIFSSFDDLDTYNAGYVAVFAVDDEGGEYVVVDFYGSTLSDDNEEVDNYIHFQTILYPDGTVEWNFLDMNFDSYGYNMFTGVYDFEADQLYTAGSAIDEASSYSGDFSGNGEFELVEGTSQNSGLNLDGVINSSFTGNSIQAAQWVSAVDIEDVVFNDDDSGNTYYLLDGEGAWTIFDITDSTGSGYADGGEDRPFSEATLGLVYWDGDGEDEYPATIVRGQRQQTSGGSTQMSREQAQRVWSAYYEKKRAQDDGDDNQAVENETPSSPTPATCPADQIITQNLRAPSRNGVYNSYTAGIVLQADRLQKHLERLGFNPGPIDGILGPLSTGAIKRMQEFLKTTPDGYVGPLTRGLLNTSCGSEGLQTN